MSNERLRQLLARLHGEIQKTELDADTRQLLRQLDTDIHDLVDTSTVTADSHSILDRARLLEARIAASHPTAERFVTEVINILARMGI